MDPVSCSLREGSLVMYSNEGKKKAKGERGEGSSSKCVKWMEKNDVERGDRNTKPKEPTIASPEVKGREKRAALRGMCVYGGKERAGADGDERSKTTKTKRSPVC